MHPIEDDLKAALRRKPAPPGFTARVLARARSEGGRRSSRRIWLLAAAASLIIASGAGVIQYKQHIRARNNAALQRTIAALSFATAQLDRAERKAVEALEK
jgi:hypothetical protein